MKCRNVSCVQCQCPRNRQRHAYSTFQRLLLFSLLLLRRCVHSQPFSLSRVPAATRMYNWFEIEHARARSLTRCLLSVVKVAVPPRKKENNRKKTADNIILLRQVHLCTYYDVIHEPNSMII